VSVIAGADKTTPRAIWAAIMRHRSLFLVGAAIFAIAAMLGSHYLPLQYTATAMFERRSDVASEDSNRNKSASFRAMKLTLQHELAGPKAIERVVEQLGLVRPGSGDRSGQRGVTVRERKDKLIREIMKRIVVRWEVRSDQVDLVSVKFTHHDPELAQKIPNALVKDYINRVSEQIVQRLQASLAFLVERVRECQDRVHELTRKKIEFELTHADMLPDDAAMLARYVHQTSTDIETLRRQRAVAERKVAYLRALVGEGAPHVALPGAWDGAFDGGRVSEAACSALACASVSVDENLGLAEAGRLGQVMACKGLGLPMPNAPGLGGPAQIVRGPNPELAKLQDRLQKYRDELDEAISIRHMTENHPSVRALRQKIAQLQERIRRTPRETVLHKVYETGPAQNELAVQLALAESELQVLTGELARLEQRLAGYRSAVASSAPIREQYLNIVRLLEEQQAEARRWQQRRTDVQMALEAEKAKRRTHLAAVQLAERPYRPVFPQAWMVLAFAIFGGLAFGGGLSLLMDTVDRSVGSLEEATRCFGVPVHAAIGEIRTTRQRAVHRLKRGVLVPAVSLVLLFALFLSAASVVLRLHDPEGYAGWAVVGNPQLAFRRVVHPVAVFLSS